MHHFFADPARIGEKEITLTGADVNHIRNVLRMRPGEEVLISDGQGTDYRCKLETLTDEYVAARICWVLEGNAELPSRITLYQGLPKGDKMEFIVQKCVELGVSRIVPMVTKRTVVKLDARKEENRVRRWNGICESAAKQSGRGLVPQVCGLKSFAEAVRDAKQQDVWLFPYELAKDMDHTRELLSSIKPGQSVGIFIGPEGGFEESEAEQAAAAGARSLTLGRRILRTETAGMAVLAVLSYLLER